MSQKVARSKAKGKIKLSDQEFVDAAVRLAKKVGLNNLTMRALADELQVSPMALYYYIPDKEQLLALTVDAIFEQIVIPRPKKSASWKKQFIALEQAASSVTNQYPDMAAYLLDMPLTPHGRILIDAYLQVFINAGFDEQEAIKAYSLIHTYMVGRMLVENRLKNKGLSSKTYDQIKSQGDLAARFRPHLGQIKGYEYRKYAYETILDALDEQLKNKPRSQD